MRIRQRLTSFGTAQWGYP